MIQLTRDVLRRWLGALLHIQDTPRRTAAAFALGVFFGFSPFLGLHTLLGILFAFLLNLNRVAVLLGVYSNLPFIVAPYYAFATIVIGAPLTRTRIPPGLRGQLVALFSESLVQRQFWHDVGTMLKPFLWPYTIGSLVGALVLAALAYPLALAFIGSRRRLHDMLHHR
jgi:uncharacterized protein (DUF2062 family)